MLLSYMLPSTAVGRSARHPDREMPLYEVMCITSVGASHRHVVNTLKRVHAAVTDRGGVVRGIEHLGNVT